MWIKPGFLQTLELCPKLAQKTSLLFNWKERTNIIVACGSTTGQVISPIVIFEATSVNHAWTSETNYLVCLMTVVDESLMSYLSHGG